MEMVMFIINGLINGLLDIPHGLYNLLLVVIDLMRWPFVAREELIFFDMKWVVQVIYYGGSKQFLFAIVDLALIILIAGLIRRQLLWGFVKAIDGFSVMVGRIAAWAVLLMVLQQVMIIFLQRLFRVSEIAIPPYWEFFLVADVSWYADELKLFNAIIVCLCAAYTFVQGGHVRVDLVYGIVSWRTKKYIDAIGSIIFVLPFMAIIWLFGWYYLWRHLVIPKVSANDKLIMLERKSKIMKWSVETFSFSPNGFDAYYLFKVLLVLFAAMMFLQGLSYFYRNILELIEGQEKHDPDFSKHSDDSIAPSTA